jgi:putative ABC transport system permease protein
MSLFRIALRNILRRRLRTALTLCGVAVGIAAFVALVGFSRSFEREWLRAYQSAGTDIAVVQKTFINTSVDIGVGPKLRALPEVADVVPMILNMMDLTPEVNALVYAWPSNCYEMDSLTVSQGRRFQDDKAEVMLGEVLAENLGKKVGDTLELQGAPFRVVGVFRGGSAFETGSALLPLGQLQKLADLGDKVSAFHVRLRPAGPGESEQQHIQKARASIEAALPGLKAVPAGERAQNNQLATLARSTAWGTSLIALLIGALGIANTMAMSVFERTREIGVLRALGWRRWRVMKLILMEAAALGFVGGVLGLAAGLAGLRILSVLPATASIAQASIPVLHALDALVIAVAIGLAAGFIPALRGARLTPVEALRYE